MHRHESLDWNLIPGKINDNPFKIKTNIEVVNPFVKIFRKRNMLRKSYKI
jgi:hypothetical protein